MRSAIRPLTLATGGRRKSVRWPHRCARIAAMSFATELFADVDRKDAALFARYLADDAVFRFANADEVVGRDNIESTLGAFYDSIKALRHERQGLYEVDDTS